MIKISEFKEKLKNVVRPNRFFVEITPPAYYTTKFDIELLTYAAQSAKIPDRMQGEVDVKYHGMTFKLPGDYSHDDLSCTFINLYDWSPRTFFEDWMNLIQNVEGDNTRIEFNGLSDATVRVVQIGNSEIDVLAVYEYYDVFPKTLQAIDLSMETTDSVEIFGVDFSYSYWKQIPNEQFIMDLSNPRNASDSRSSLVGRPRPGQGPVVDGLFGLAAGLNVNIAPNGKVKVGWQAGLQYAANGIRAGAAAGGTF